MHEGVRKTLGDRRFSPRKVVLPLGSGLAAHALGEAQHAVRRIRPAGEHDVLDVLQQLARDVVVDRQAAGVDDPHVESRVNRVVQERGVHRLAHDVVAAEGKRQVGHAAGDERSRAALLEERHGLHEGEAVTVVLLHPGGHGQHVRIEDDVLRGETDLLREQVVRAPQDLHLALHRVRLAGLVERHHHGGGPEAADLPRLREEVLLSLLEADGVDDALSLEALETGHDHLPARAVDHDRQTRHLGLGGHQVEERRHRLDAVEQVGVHVHVQEVRPASHLVDRHLQCATAVVGFHEAPERGGPGHVGALADDHERRVLVDDERLEPAEARLGGARRHAPRREALHRICDSCNVLWSRAATAAHAVDETVLRELPQQRRGAVGCLVVPAERVGQPRVGVADDRHGRDVGQLVQERAHLLAPQGAVDAHGKRVGVLDRDPEGVDRLAGQRAPTAVDHRERDHEGNVRGHVLRRGDRRLGIERVEDRLHEQEVDPACDERCDLLRVRRCDVVERHGAVRRVVDLRGEGQRHVQRAERAGDEARPVGGRGRVAGLARDPGGGDVDLGHGLLEAVVGLADARRREGVRGRDVRAGFQVRVVGGAHHVGAGQREHVGVAGDVLVVVAEPLAPVVLRREAVLLEHRAPRAVEDDDPLLEDLTQSFSRAHVPLLRRPGDHAYERVPAGRRGGSLGVF